MNPSSVLASYEFGAGMGSRGSADARVERRGRKGKLESGSTSAAEGGRRDGLLCYGQLMETQRPFLSSVTPLPALQSLLLFSSKIDTSEDASLVRRLGDWAPGEVVFQAQRLAFRSTARFALV